ncbi:MAG: restriction endonuclease subunit M [Bacteroidales bacterium]|nr:restriction endonuclease subunit M [Bacteroidales bacterium]
MPFSANIDISENDLLRHGREVLEILLLDQTTGHNILWGTDDYVDRGDGYQANQEITIDKITGANGRVIQPRACKSAEAQKVRVRNKAEVFTPSWVCNAQNNLIDEAWFGRPNVFNTETPDHTWETNPDPIEFPKGKTWQDYVLDNRLEITCGEAPYLVSWYDTVTKEIIPLPDRIGMLDRKLRVVNERVHNYKHWHRWARFAFQSIYGFEWQGDSLLIARETLLKTFFDYRLAKFGEHPKVCRSYVRRLAEIISWNLWQMDGLTGQKIMTSKQKFNEMFESQNQDFCKIRDWGDPRQVPEPAPQAVYFVSLLKNNQS